MTDIQRLEAHLDRQRKEDNARHRRELLMVQQQSHQHRLEWQRAQEESHVRSHGGLEQWRVDQILEEMATPLMIWYHTIKVQDPFDPTRVTDMPDEQRPDRGIRRTHTARPNLPVNPEGRESRVLLRYSGRRRSGTDEPSHQDGRARGVQPRVPKFRILLCTRVQCWTC